MTQHISNLARRAAHEVKHQVAHQASRIADVPHQLRHQLEHHLKHHLSQHLLTIVALVVLVFSMGGTWTLASDANAAPNRPPAATVAANTSAKAANTSASSAPGSTARGSSTVSDDTTPSSRPAKKQVTGKLNLNTATEEQLMLLPTIGPSKAERVVTWRKKNGGFKRTADIRRVKGFGYKTFKRLEPFLDIKGETTLSAKR